VCLLKMTSVLSQFLERVVFICYCAALSECVLIALHLCESFVARMIGV